MGRHADVSHAIVLGAAVGAAVLGAGVFCTAHAQDAVRVGSVHGSVIKAVHFTELRTRIHAFRSAAGLARFSWTDPALRSGVTRVRRVHLLELRTALGGAYRAAGHAAPRWTDAAPAPAPGSTPIPALHVTELRAAVLALE